MKLFLRKIAVLVSLLISLEMSAISHYTAPTPSSSIQTFNELHELIRRRHIRSIEELLPLLPRDYRRGYALAYSSHSSQAAAPKTPRVIMHGNNSRLILAFDSSSQTLETMERNPKTQEFVLRTITFSPASRAAPQIEHHPQSCIACHGAPAHPIWTDYPFPMIGFYNRELNSGAYNLYHRYTASRMQHPRYKNLIPYDEVGNTGASSRLFLAGSGISGDLSQGASIAFAYQLEGPIQRRIADAVSRAPQLARYRYLIAGYFARCFGSENRSYREPNEVPDPHWPKFIDFFPPSESAVVTRGVQAARDRYLQHGRTILSDAHRLQADRMDYNEDRVDLAQFNYILERLGLSLGNLSTSRRGREFFVSGPSTSSMDTTFSNLVNLWRDDSTIQQLFRVGRVLRGNEYTAGPYWIDGEEEMRTTIPFSRVRRPNHFSVCQNLMNRSREVLTQGGSHEQIQEPAERPAASAQ